MIELSGVSRRFGRVQALAEVSFSVGAGEIVGFLGPNGAGKTTTLRILAGFLAADAGRLRVGGVDVVEEPLRARAQVGVLPEGAPLYPEMRVRDFLRFRARLKEVPRRQIAARVEETLSWLELGEVAARPCGQLSRGFRQRVGLADALIARPPLLLLDEPSGGLDPGQQRELRALLTRLAPAHTVLLSSHQIAEVEAIASRVLIIARGRIVADERKPAPGELEALYHRLVDGERPA